jgi:hypothetical protein
MDESTNAEFGMNLKLACNSLRVERGNREKMGHRELIGEQTAMKCDGVSKRELKPTGHFHDRAKPIAFLRIIVHDRLILMIPPH